MTTEPGPFRSTADARRSIITRRAVEVFARSGYRATPVADVAKEAGISPAYVFRLYDGKLGLFLAALEHCHERVIETLTKVADEMPGGEPGAVLSAMGDAYAQLISDRDLLMLQVHALSSVDVPEIAAATRRGLERTVTLLKERTGAPDPAIQQFIAYGQLCHLIVAAGLADLTGGDGTEPRWAKVLTDGMAHPGSGPGAAAGR
ncbi:TetR/AcrR family transcriptional regulator [Amycolatopsis saalfeldensis]|uniref:DNA-binding transcriptional regulator, AcrR family n=1 Tax=Amycolatopsis saalfeldensis TaxID=394193 RepID=A0A1H8WPZ5_9PSEU|nr:TetR/AcrR family transcriptional regulator [Amycolatopsis saalfeldensis]SEP29573.1 DNA-binding transcriptional regulator, AcrR family [Amycolatopsis saalfeldensis]